MYNVMKNLITNKYYPTKEEAVEKLDVFLAYNRITADQYAELMALADEKYAESTVTSSDSTESEEVATE